MEMASVDNVKRTWVNYGGTREWSDPTQGQVGGRGECGLITVCECMHAHFVLLAEYTQQLCLWRLYCT